MNFKNLLILTALVFGINGLSAILIPEIVGTLFGIESCPSTIMIAQLSGLGSLAISLFAWLLRNNQESKTQKSVTLTLFIINFIGIILSVKGTISGIINFGWPVIIFYGIFSVSFLYLRFKKI